MKLVSYRTREAFAGEPGRADNLGVVLAGAVVPASALGDGVAASMGELLSGWPASLPPIEAAVAAIHEAPPRMLNFEQIELLPPVPRPGKIVAAGVNYHAHASEGGKGSRLRQLHQGSVGPRGALRDGRGQRRRVRKMLGIARPLAQIGAR